MRYPWHISTVVGLFVITGLRPCTRHVPDAPPIVAPMPDFALQSTTGAPVTPATLSPTIWIAGFVCVECKGATTEVGPTLAELSQRIETHSKPLKVLAIATDAPTDQGAWSEPLSLASTTSLALSGPRETIASLKDQVAVAFGPDQPRPWDRIFIIDDLGQLRGAYALGEMGADEAYHRAQHVARDSKHTRKMNLGRPR
jgi:hypothetical protein